MIDPIVEMIHATRWPRGAPRRRLDEAIRCIDTHLHVVADPRRGPRRAHAECVASYAEAAPPIHSTFELKMEVRSETAKTGVRGVRVTVEQMNGVAKINTRHVNREANVIVLHIITAVREICVIEYIQIRRNRKCVYQIISIF